MPMVRMLPKWELTNPRMYGSKTYRNIFGRCGLVEIVPTNDHVALQAHPCRQTHSGDLKVYVQIELSERGKAMAFIRKNPTKNNKRVNHC